MAKLLLLNGPKLKLPGAREPTLYGVATLTEIERRCTELAQQLGPHDLSCFQSNAEHERVNGSHAARAEDVALVVINPAAFSHTSIALRTAAYALATARR